MTEKRTYEVLPYLFRLIQLYANMIEKYMEGYELAGIFALTFGIAKK